MNAVSTEFAIHVPPEAWEEDDLDDAPSWVRLLTTLVINGTRLHLEAWAINNDGDLQSVHEPFAEDFALLHRAVGADGHFQTTEIRGREYVVLATPFC